jgi:hypothetical protein
MKYVHDNLYNIYILQLDSTALISGIGKRF